MMERKGELRMIEPIISWEYWNGKGWNGLFILVTNSRKNTRS